MAIKCRPMERSDVTVFHHLLASYNREFLHLDSSPSIETLSRDGLGARFRVVLAEAESPIGFAAWAYHYDLHHGLVGGDVLDMYVAPEVRGRGVAAQLIAETAAQIRGSGGAYIRGQVLTSEHQTARLYNRVSHQFSGADCYVSGRAFRSLADLAGESVRTLIRGMPPKTWNHEP